MPAQSNLRHATIDMSFLNYFFNNAYCFAASRWEIAMRANHGLENQTSFASNREKTIRSIRYTIVSWRVRIPTAIQQVAGKQNANANVR